VVFAVKVVPASSRTELSGLLDGMVKIKLSAAPEKGKANKALLAFLAEKLGVKKNSISIIAGETCAVKKIQVLGISAQALSEKLH
jgi:uncharacterized protein (TIGR00251 family)